MSYDRIELPPNEDRDAYAPIGALIAALGMNVVFDDVTDLPGIRFCFHESEESPFIDYEISEEDLEAWYQGDAPLILEALPHDPDRFDIV